MIITNIVGVIVRLYDNFVIICILFLSSDCGPVATSTEGYAGIALRPHLQIYAPSLLQQHLAPHDPPPPLQAQIQLHHHPTLHPLPIPRPLLPEIPHRQNGVALPLVGQWQRQWGKPGCF